MSAAPVEIGRVIAERLGLTGAIGTVAEIDNGTYTGRLVGDLMHGQAKAEAIRQLAAVEGLDLARCTAYSDSINDLPMLTTVGHAVAVNPDSALPAGREPTRVDTCTTFARAEKRRGSRCRPQRSLGSWPAR